MRAPHHLLAPTLIGLAVMLFGAGCQAAAPTAPPTATSAASEVAMAPPTADELRAIQFRKDFSLQADLAHVRAVALDPSSGMEFGVPLLPSEFEELMSRSANTDELLAIVEAEAATAPNDYCGVYLDQANEGALTSAWRANRFLHELAIRAKVRPGAKVAFVDCQYSKVEVKRVCDLLGDADDAWLQTVPAAVKGMGCGNANFRVELHISSAVPDAADRVLAHYTSLWDLPPGILHVDSDGTGAALRGRGTLLITVLRPNGKPVGPSELGLNWAGLDLPDIQCGVGDMGFGVSWDETPTELPCQEGRWRIEVVSGGVLFGHGEVVLGEGETVELTITLTKDPPPPT